MKILLLCLLSALGNSSIYAQTACGNVQLQLTPDYNFTIGSSSGGSTYTFTIGSQTLAQGAITQLALFHYDNSVASTSGIAPSQSTGASFVPGRFGSAISAAPGGTLSYPQAGNVSFADGTVEMWVAPQYDGDNSIYTVTPGTPQAQVLFHSFWGGNGGELILGIGNDGGGVPYFYVGAAGVYAGYQQASGIAGWKSGEWHHLAFTYSTSNGRLRIYVDGALADETDAAIQFPAVSPNTFTIGGDAFGNESAFAVDEVRISSNEIPAAAIAYDASRSTPFVDDEVFVSLAGVPAGQLSYSVGGCGSATYDFTSTPISNFSPASGLLSAGSASVTLAFNTVQPTTCSYSVGNELDYPSMLPLDTGPPVTAHVAVASGLSTDPRVLNQLYVRCASDPDYLQSATYRVVAAPAGSFPRIGNIWIGNYLNQTQPAMAQKVHLFLGPGLSVADADALRATNPDVLILLNTQVDDAFDPTLPETYYLHDTNGNRVSDWPGSYIYNMTRPEVATYVGQQAYQLLAPNFAFDGMFFDSFSASKAVNTIDAYGNSIQIDADGDGLPDNQAWLSAAWSAGEYLVVSTFHSLAPGAYISGHVLEAPAQAQSLAAFNGTSLEFYPQSVREGQTSFGQLWDLYHAWDSQGVSPVMTMVQASPPDQLSYGYGYNPLNSLLPSTLAFAQSSYPNMRFGLGLTLMGNGFFGFDFGDEAPPVTWWYDEYDFKLGSPISPPAQIGGGESASLLVNGGFESGLSGWQLDVINDGQAQASATADQSTAADGNSSAHIAIVSPGTINWHIDLEQDNVALIGQTQYQVQFWARADSPRTITLFLQGGAPNYPDYGLLSKIGIGTSWSLYSASFTATATANDGRLEFLVGDLAGDVWLDDVALSAAPPPLYRRDYTNGIVLVNGTTTPQTVTLEPGFNRFTGTQAPLYQQIVDDSDIAFSDTGSWNTVAYNTGAYSSAGSSANLPAEPQNQNGPFYHCWNGSCHELDSGGGQAQWNLNLQADGQYTIQVWLPAAPNAANWTNSAVYEVVTGGNVVASATIDQTTASAGDAWHAVAMVSLSAADAPFLRVHNGGAGALIADAVYITSAALYNDGSPAPQVTLGAFDSILMQRQQPLGTAASQVNSVANAAGYQPAIASGGVVSIVGTGFGSSSRSWTSSDFSGSNLPLSLDGVAVTINGKPGYVESISPTQITAIAPDDDTIGQVAVQVTTPQGASYPGTVLKQKLSPGLFTYQPGMINYASAVHADGIKVGPAGPSSRPAAPGEVIQIYGTGFGATIPATPTAQLVSQPAPTALPVTVTIGGVTAEVQWAGVVSSGLYELSVQIPNLATGDQVVQASISGFQTAPNIFLPVSAN